MNFIGLERSRGQSIYCHIHWLARACQCILVTKIRLLAVFSVLVLLFKSVANNHIVDAEKATNHALELIYFDFNAQ